MAILCGLLAGTSSAIFLALLNWTTIFRQQNPVIIWGLPIVGLLIGFIFHKYGGDISGGSNLVIDEIHTPKKTIPFKMAPLVLLGTLFTHLFGGSAGRESAAVQLGATLSDQLSKIFRVESKERKILLVAGSGAAFGAAIGAPFAGAIFGMEMIWVGRFKLIAWWESLIASMVAYFTFLAWGQALGYQHTNYPKLSDANFEPQTFLWVAVAGVIFGLSSRALPLATDFFKKLINRSFRYPPFRPMAAGLILVSLFYFEGSGIYSGLGIEHILGTFNSVSSFKEPFLKTLFTALTVGSGFKGGEFIPLVFIGATLGSALSLLIPISGQLLASLGFAAVFAGAANTPIACAIMAIEIFGVEIAPYSIIACIMSYLFSGKIGIYPSQKSQERNSST